MKPKILNREQLVDVLRSIANSIEANDSYEGYIRYNCKEQESKDDFSVESWWRYGNADGMGYVASIGKFDNED